MAVETEEGTAQPTGLRAVAPKCPRALPQGRGYLFKRAILGPPIPTHRLSHERLGKITALPIFASDALSSVAYATEEMMRAMYVAAGVAMFSLIMPISFAIAVILVTLIFSYRQTIKAYPSAGGAYVVTRDNFGLVPAQVAGAALLTDYVLTVAVSISAGVAAIVTAATDLHPYRVPLALFFLVVLVWGNLRGVRESGKMFALPTYLFIFGVYALLATGFYRLALGGGITPASTAHLPPAPADVGLLYGVSLFVVLRAMASGNSALTGVEAVSNGIPAFKPPEWRNARTTLMIMGTILGTMFLGIGFLVSKLHIAPDLTDRKTVLGLLAEHLFGSSSFGHVAFLYVQIVTMAVLVLAANTSFADFPRLASFQAGDAFLPRQFTRRGHRLVFSNGILALGATAGLLIVIFQANVTRLIPLYALGVFTSFTLSQAGMARRHFRLREPGWRHGFVINAFGAVITGVVDVIIAITKFPGDVAILVLVPVMVMGLVRMNRQYQQEHRELEEHIEPFDRSEVRRPTALLLVDRLDHPTMHALQYAKTIRPANVRAVHFEAGDASNGLEQSWRELGIDIPLEVVRHNGSFPSSLARYVGALPEDADVNVIVPAPAAMSPLERLRRGRTTSRMTRALLPFDRARITLIRDHPGPGHVMTESIDGRKRLRIVPRTSHRVVVLVDKVDRAVIRAVSYSLSLGTTDVWAVHAAVDPDLQELVIRRWMELGLPVPLDVIECWDRNIARSLERYLVEQMGQDAEITIVMPRRDYAALRQRILHDRTSRKIAQALGRYEHVDLTIVPFYFGNGDGGRRAERPRSPGNGRGRRLS
ncbi:MAG: APC family permease [Actinomycetota bacterium]